MDELEANRLSRRTAWATLQRFRKFLDENGYDQHAEKLKTKGHLVAMWGPAGNPMGHTRVVYGVGDPSNEYFSVFDPLKGHGFEFRKFSELSGNIYVGWAK